ncbi:hypothetical protein CYMTET_21054, partial [Cymbomonas tetramitiformis]
MGDAWTENFTSIVIQLLNELSAHIPSYPDSDIDRDGCVTASEFTTGWESFHMHLRLVADRYEGLQNLSAAPHQSGEGVEHAVTRGLLQDGDASGAPLRLACALQGGVQGRRSDWRALCKATSRGAA